MAVYSFLDKKGKNREQGTGNRGQGSGEEVGKRGQKTRFRRAQQRLHINIRLFAKMWVIREAILTILEMAWGESEANSGQIESQRVSNSTRSKEGWNAQTWIGRGAASTE
jgi:hypothetical protein